MPPWMELGILGVTALGFLVVGSAIIWASVAPLPSIDNFENRKVSESTKLFDRTGDVVLYDVYGQIRRTAVSLEDISPYVQKATIAIEDDAFYEHHGFRPKAFLRAVLVNLRLMPGIIGQGGSTITQQVVKNALLTQRKTIARKLEEIILALRLERLYSKEEILSTYLNETPYGGTVYGVEEASQYYYGKTAAEVTLAEAAYLAALPQAPTRYSPYGNNRDLLEARQKLVLSRMLETGAIADEEYATASGEEVDFRDTREAGIKAPHFVFYIREYLEEKYGADAVVNDGLRVITTLDWELQEKAEEVVSRHAPSMLANFNASNEGLVAVDPTTGQILAMVGSRDYFSTEIDGAVNIALAHRQPGSSFKPFVYATAFKKGYTPETVVFDVKTQFSTLCSPTDFSSEDPCYSPVNYDGTFKGPIDLRHALAQSVNIPAVKVLYMTGIENAIETAENMGITTLEDANRYGLTLVLGGGEVTLLDLTGAYGVFANDGVKNTPTGILRIEDRDGKVLEEYSQASARVLDSQIARQITDVLSDDEARAAEFGTHSPLYFSQTPVAAKTGTTNDFRDVWVVGYTPGIALGAWAGNNDNTPLEKRVASFVITPMWREIMQYAIEKYPAEDFEPPAPDAGTDDLPAALRGEWNTDPSEGIHSILHWVDKDRPRSNVQPADPWSDPQYVRWEYPVALWIWQSLIGSTEGFSLPPGFESFISPVTSYITELQIMSPAPGSTVVGNTPLTLSAQHPDPENVFRVSYYINDELAGFSTEPPYIMSLTPSARGVVQLRAVAETTSGLEESTLTFTIK